MAVQSRNRSPSSVILEANGPQFWFEAFITFYLLLALGLNYVNIYKTIWWLPHGPSSSILNFYLIDRLSLAFLFVIVVFRLQYLFSFKVSAWCEDKFPTKRWLGTAVMFLLPLICMAVLKCCVFVLLYQQKIWQTTFLIYPALLCLLFRSTISEVVFGSDTKDLADDKFDSSMLFGVRHVCNADTKHIREEVKVFWGDVCSKVQLIVLLVVTYTYYVGFIPIVLIPDHLIYDLPWLLMHAVFVCESLLMILILYLLPHSYFNELYSSALHLGLWQPWNSSEPPGSTLGPTGTGAAGTAVGASGDVGNVSCLGTSRSGLSSSPSSNGNKINWSVRQLFSFLRIVMQTNSAMQLPVSTSSNSRSNRNSNNVTSASHLLAQQAKKAGYSEWSASGTVDRSGHVIYNNQVFTALTSFPAAEPANMAHIRFYLIFSQPMIIHSVVLCVHMLTVIAQISLFLMYVHWSEVTSLCLMLFVNFYLLFKLLKDQFLFKEIYAH